MVTAAMLFIRVLYIAYIAIEMKSKFSDLAISIPSFMLLGLLVTNFFLSFKFTKAIHFIGALTLANYLMLYVDSTKGSNILIQKLCEQAFFITYCIV
jgi:hypothetical protein